MGQGADPRELEELRVKYDSSLKRIDDMLQENSTVKRENVQLRTEIQTLKARLEASDRSHSR